MGEILGKNGDVLTKITIILLGMLGFPKALYVRL